MRTRQGIIQIHCEHRRLLTTYTVSPSRPDGNIHDPTCAAKVTLEHTRRLSLSLNDKPRFTAQMPTTHEWNNAKSMSLEEDDQNHHAPTRLYTMSCHTHTCPRPEPLQKTHETRGMEIQTLRTNTSCLPPTFPHCHMHHAHPQIQPPNPDVATAKHGGFAMHVSHMHILRTCLHERQNRMCDVHQISFPSRQWFVTASNRASLGAPEM